MVRPYYVDEVTRISEQELEAVFQTVEPPACLLGGWAVHIHVNDGFRAEHGRSYIGSRDIDVGVHIDPGWKAEEVENSAAGESIQAIQSLEYERSRFGFVKHFDRQTGDRIGEEELQELPQHRTFELFIDIIPDAKQLDVFEEVFGFRPPAEPLLNRCFDKGRAVSLADETGWDVPGEVLVAEPSLLAAMKIRSIPHRDKQQKRVKDVADLHALIWHVQDYDRMREKVVAAVGAEDLERLFEHLDDDVYAQAADLLQVQQSLVAESIRGLHRVG